jgi:hypothetical protein
LVVVVVFVLEERGRAGYGWCTSIYGKEFLFTSKISGGIAGFVVLIDQLQEAKGCLGDGFITKSANSQFKIHMFTDEYYYLLRRGVFRSRASPVHEQKAVGINTKVPFSPFLKKATRS